MSLAISNTVLEGLLVGWLEAPIADGWHPLLSCGAQALHTSASTPVRRRCLDGNK
ncbi:uncharacterized protein CLUP02_00009 [Colletotrichum lupini]|uniref:Uncharacterized protein n=1 Tax=Colletotrichum lupini TaxID=145971 RepID=A0A9Q8S9S8_9PEZI|nr:uncharacterized protein CLUP02_00009 [Colletotrichum lupini]UQC73365.1 hypothetical protein CLUP02_00009 [Colletotrichum lupini]